MTVDATGRGLASFVLRVLGLGVVFFALWSLGHGPISSMTAWPAARIATVPAAVESASIRRQGRTVVFDIEPSYETARRGRLVPGTVFEVSADPLKYSFGLPFFFALLVASRPAGLAWKLPAGAAIVLALASVGLACEVLIQVGSVPGPGATALFALRGKDAIALGFQLGSLIFPSVVPAMLWAAMDSGTIRRFARIGPREAPE
jgi:hypothetical protein